MPIFLHPWQVVLKSSVFFCVFLWFKPKASIFSSGGQFYWLERNRFSYICRGSSKQHSYEVWCCCVPILITTHTPHPPVGHFVHWSGTVLAIFWRGSSKQHSCEVWCCCVPILITMPPAQLTSAERIHGRGTGHRASVPILRSFMCVCIPILVTTFPAYQGGKALSEWS